MASGKRRPNGWPEVGQRSGSAAGAVADRFPVFARKRWLRTADQWRRGQTFASSWVIRDRSVASRVGAVTKTAIEPLRAASVLLARWPEPKMAKYAWSPRPATSLTDWWRLTSDVRLWVNSLAFSPTWKRTRTSYLPR